MCSLNFFISLFKSFSSKTPKYITELTVMEPTRRNLLDTTRLLLRALLVLPRL